MCEEYFGGPPNPRIEEAGFQIEKAMFMSAYVVRKLIENRKIEDRISTLELACFSSIYIGPSGSRIFGSDIKRDFDHKAKQSTLITLQRLCNELIHAKIFVNGTTREDMTLEGFWVCSDFSQDKRIVFVSFEDWKLALRMVAESSPNSVTAKRDPATGKFKIRVE